MPLFRSRFIAAVFAAVIVSVGMGPAAGQSGEPKAAEPNQQPGAATDATKERQKKIDEYAEAARLLSGPAGNPECVRLGRNVVSLLWNDDFDTAFRHLDLYDRFGCPGAHIQATFRCLVRQGDIDPKAGDGLRGRAHACWVNPDLPAPTAATAATPSGNSNQ
jgi:hypothetical protein